MSLFHALGKFLYNKRINPKTKQVEHMTPKDMLNSKKRPKTYFIPDEVIQQSMVSAGTFGLYLYQNMSNFYGDIGDLADCLEIYSE